MRTVLSIIRKEFLQLKRNRVMLPIIFFIPIVQMVILVHAATFEMKNIRMYVVDKDLSGESRELLAKFQASPFYEITDYSTSEDEGQQQLRTGQSHLVLHIPHGFGKDLRGGKAQVQLQIDAINGQTASLVNAYTQGIIMDYNRKILAKWLDPSVLGMATSVNISYQHWFNPELNYTNFMVPGILVILVTIIGMFLGGMNLVREKEIGTIEQINVTPIKKWQFIVGKLAPFWIISLFELAFGLAIGKLLFDNPILGPVWVIFLVAAVYLVVILGMGLLISTITETQQQAMFISWFFLLIFVLMSGIFTSTDSMPQWAQELNRLNPIAYFMKAIRMIMLKGSGLADVAYQIYVLAGFGLVMIAVSVGLYRKTA